MTQAAHHDCKESRGTHRTVPARKRGALRGMRLSAEPNAAALVERVLASTRLDGAMLGYVKGVFTTTVRDWVQRRS